MPSLRNRIPAAFSPLLLALLIFCALGQNAAAASSGWAPSWIAAQTAPYGSETLPPGSLDNATIRETVHLSSGGSRLALKISNTFGATVLQVHSVHVALRQKGAGPGLLDPHSDLELHFNGHAEVTLPAGAEVTSDPLAMSVQPLEDLVVDLEITHAPAAVTLHAGARATTFTTQGFQAVEPTLSSPQTSTRWYFLSGVYVSGDSGRRGAVVLLGDSITDGHGATTDANDRWPDVLSRRLNAKGTRSGSFGVANAGIGGNRLLADGIGPNALARLDRDVLAQPGVTALLVLEGINDLGTLDRVSVHTAAEHHAQLVQLEDALQTIAVRAHMHGMRVLGGTVMPFVGSGYYHPSPATEGDRVALNQWIRTSGAFDAVVDFDQVTRDPAHPDRLLPAYDSGDHLHPGPAGYRAMGEAVPLGNFLPQPASAGRAR